VSGVTQYFYLAPNDNHLWTTIIPQLWIMTRLQAGIRQYYFPNENAQGFWTTVIPRYWLFSEIGFGNRREYFMPDINSLNNWSRQLIQQWYATSGNQRQFPPSYNFGYWTNTPEVRQRQVMTFSGNPQTTRWNLARMGHPDEFTGPIDFRINPNFAAVSSDFQNFFHGPGRGVASTTRFRLDNSAGQPMFAPIPSPIPNFPPWVQGPNYSLPINCHSQYLVTWNIDGSPSVAIRDFILSLSNENNHWLFTHGTRRFMRMFQENARVEAATPEIFVTTQWGDVPILSLVNIPPSEMQHRFPFTYGGVETSMWVNRGPGEDDGRMVTASLPRVTADNNPLLQHVPFTNWNGTQGHPERIIPWPSRETTVRRAVNNTHTIIYTDVSGQEVRMQFAVNYQMRYSHMNFDGSPQSETRGPRVDVWDHTMSSIIH
jgi:hypothetical protein